MRPVALSLLLALLAPLATSAADKPNVLVLYMDDMGWAQPGCYGGKLAPTPHIDSLARNGVRFTDGYVGACICSPSRVGLLTGRYQARTGHDANSNEGKSPESKNLLLSETTIAQRLKSLGYVTGIYGKWHVGATSPEYLPANRGFDESFGTTGNLGDKMGFYKGKEFIPDPAGAPITSPIYAREANAFMERHRAEPWFLYVPFNAVHSPVVASPEIKARFPDLPKGKQDYAALISEADDAVGAILAKLRELKLEENTLIFLVSDNGGASALAEMDGLRGRKWMLWEGGIRVSWLAQWKGRIPAGRVLETPVIQLDILPTALAAAGGTPQPEWKLDGANLLPLLEGKADKLDRDTLYWRFGVQYAVRQGDWKLVKAGLAQPVQLFDLRADRHEKDDLAAKQPEKVKALQALWDAWNAQNMPPRWEDPRWNDGNTKSAPQAAKKKGAKQKAAK
jgi:arylsulfatase A-like enzyme